MLHYFAKQFYSPTLISPSLDDDDLTIYLVHEETTAERFVSIQQPALKFKPRTAKQLINEQMNAFTMERTSSSWTLQLSIYDWSKPSPLKSWTQKIDQVSQLPLIMDSGFLHFFQLNMTSNIVFHGSISSMLKEAGCPAKVNCFLYMQAVTNDQQHSVDNWLPFSYFNRAVGLSKAQIKVHIHFILLSLLCVLLDMSSVCITFPLLQVALYLKGSSIISERG
jgi:hypothetical protein